MHFFRITLFFIASAFTISLSSLRSMAPRHELTILGSGACIPLPHRRSPGNLLHTNGKYFLIDSGVGTLHALVQQGIQPPQLSGAFYSHFHLDHIGELVNIITWFQVVNWTADKIGAAREEPLFTIYGPVGIENYIKASLAITPGRDFPDHFKIIEVLPGQSLQLDGFKVEIHKTKHTAESVGYRFNFDDNTSLAISGDTGYDPSVVELIKGADVAVLECSYDDEVYEKTKSFVNHLGPTTAGQLAAAGGIKTLVLTHLYPSADAIDVAAVARQVFPGKVITAQDGMKITLN